MTDIYTDKIAARLKDLRLEQGFSLDQLADLSGISRATLSRFETASVSPTTEMLGKLCAVYGMSLSQLLIMAEDAYSALVPQKNQISWRDTDTGFTRKTVSPPAKSLAGEIIHCTLAPGAEISYQTPPVLAQEHHLVLLTGQLSVSVDGVQHNLNTGDCLRYHLRGPSIFKTGAVQSAEYMLLLVEK